MSEKKSLYSSPGEKGKRGFEDLECYQLALEVMSKVHAFSKTLPADEKYDLYAQIRRASKNVTGNIAEAYGRYHYLGSLHYYSIARGEVIRKFMTTSPTSLRNDLKMKLLTDSEVNMYTCLLVSLSPPLGDP